MYAGLDAPGIRGFVLRRRRNGESSVIILKMDTDAMHEVSLKAQVAVITGAGRGIGAAIAHSAAGRRSPCGRRAPDAIAAIIHE